MKDTKDAIHNRVAIEAATDVSCFYCMRVYLAIEVVKWTDEGATAICPRCGVDSVIAGKLNPEHLQYLHECWFGPVR